MASARASKQKGKDFEKEVAASLATWLGVPEEDITNARGGKKEADVRMSSEAADLFPYHLEAKNHRTLKIPEWIDQASADASGKKAPLQLAGDPDAVVPVVVFKRHRDTQKWVCLPFADFMRLATKDLALRKKLRAALRKQ